MSRKPGLFGSRPSVLLVDDRPRGIDLQSVQATPLPALQDEPEVDIIDEPEEAEGDDDSYDGGGPLRIFIGSPNRAAGATPPVLPSLPTPIWDASALASATYDDEPTAAEPAASKARPVLRKPGAIEPPPLTMSFGRSFSRGSMDAGVMDDGLTAIDGEAQRDSVVVHQQIYDRLLRFDDPADRSGLGPFDSADSDDEPLSVGASDEDEVSSHNAGQVAPAFLTEAPPARTLNLQLQTAEPKPDDASDSFSDIFAEAAREPAAEPSPELRRAPATPPVMAPPLFPLDDEPSLPWDDDEPDAIETGDISGSLDSLTQPLDVVDPPVRKVFGDGARPKPIVVADSPPTVPPTVFPRTTPVPAASSVATPAPTPAPDWSAQRREAQAQGRGQPAVGEEPGGGVSLGLVIFGLLVVALLVGSWAMLRKAEPPPAPQTPAQPFPGPAPSDVLTPELQAPPAEPTEPSPAGEGAAVDGQDELAGPTETVAASDELPGPDQGLLLIRATRPSRVFIDGRYVGHTPLPSQVLTVGTHEVRVVAIESGRTREQTVRIDAGQSRDLRFSF